MVADYDKQEQVEDGRGQGELERKANKPKGEEAFQVAQQGRQEWRQQTHRPKIKGKQTSAVVIKGQAFVDTIVAQESIDCVQDPGTAVDEQCQDGKTKQRGVGRTREK